MPRVASDNLATEQLGFDAVLLYESERKRTSVRRVRRCGYDLVSTNEDGSDERHIEVKATAGKRFTFRWLEDKEQECAEKDAKFFLYLVTNAGTPAARVHEYSGKKLTSRFRKKISQHVYVFPKSDFV